MSEGDAGAETKNESMANSGEERKAGEFPLGMATTLTA